MTFFYKGNYRNELSLTSFWRIRLLIQTNWITRSEVKIFFLSWNAHEWPAIFQNSNKTNLHPPYTQKAMTVKRLFSFYRTSCGVGCCWWWTYGKERIFLCLRLRITMLRKVKLPSGYDVGHIIRLGIFVIKYRTFVIYLFEKLYMHLSPGVRNAFKSYNSK